MRESVIQMGYVARDLDEALDYWINVVGAGPFFVADFATDNQTYRGRPTNAHVTIAMGYSGDMQIEVARQNNDAPSAYMEAFAGGRSAPRGGIFHHVMIAHDDYDAIYRKYLEAGATRCFDAEVSGVGRFCYLDTRSLMDCFLELLEVSPTFAAACRRMRALHADWDGADPIRSYPDLIAQVT